MSATKQTNRRPTSVEVKLALAMFNKSYNDLSLDEKRKLQLRMQEGCPSSLDELRKAVPFMFKD